MSTAIGRAIEVHAQRCVVGFQPAVIVGMKHQPVPTELVVQVMLGGVYRDGPLSLATRMCSRRGGYHRHHDPSDEHDLHEAGDENQNIVHAKELNKTWFLL